MATNSTNTAQNQLTVNYESGLEGTLLRISESAESRYEFEIWFDYTRHAMNLIREGALLAVENFSSSLSEKRYSLLEVVSLLPMHYALGERPEGYPGFVVEAAHSAARDWVEQEQEATEEVTKIRCIAIPTNQEIRQNSNATLLEMESNLPMVGARVYVLDTASTTAVLNYGIRHHQPRFEVGRLIRDSQVSVEIVPEEMLRTHFAIFGFTGAGKSNLISTLIHKTLQAYENHTAEGQRSVVKILVFDLMSEYATLLPDWLLKLPNACVVALTEETLPEAVLRYMEQPANANSRDLKREARQVLVRTTLYPKALATYRAKFGYFWHEALNAQTPRIKVWKEEVGDLGRLLRSLWQPRDLGRNDAEIRRRVEAICKAFEGKPLTQETLREANLQIENDLENAQVQRSNRDQSEGSALLSKAGARESVREWKEALQKYAESAILNHSLQPQFVLSEQALLGDLDSRENSSLYVFQSSDPDLLRRVAARIGEKMFERRRRSGRIEPLVLFLMDEADEFIPQKAEGSYAESRTIAMTLARRGRKFGLCLGIATQRVRYLDTSIMAQPHTYFVSKMPRKSDRDAIAEAFGISEEMFRQTFKFQKGDWLLMS
ncbi:MAG: DUF87 domain-containing protein, partial [Fimbriimonadales bacterium]|nr:DUF87 domain-containing protein [Fimbriimonadales bacterium]